MATPTGYIHAAKEGALLARTESRSDVQDTGYPATLHLGQIKALQGGGTYQVDILGDDGVAVHTSNYIHTWPTPGAERSVGELVAVIVWPGNQVPAILETGSGGCAAGLTDWGVLID